MEVLARRLSKAFTESFLEVGREPFVLRHRGADKFLSKYLHGPYARSLLLVPLGSGSFLLCFAFRGWRPSDRKQGEADKAPRVCALHIRLCREKADPLKLTGGLPGHEDQGPVTALEILSVGSRAVDDELDGFCKLPTGDGITLLAGKERAGMVSIFRSLRSVSNSTRAPSWRFGSRRIRFNRCPRGGAVCCGSTTRAGA